MPQAGAATKGLLNDPSPSDVVAFISCRSLGSTRNRPVQTTVRIGHP